MMRFIVLRHVMVLRSAIASMLRVCACWASVDEAVCNDPKAHGQYIARSLELVNGGADRTHVLDTLLCIVQSEATTGYVATQAVGAIFHLAHENRVIQEYMLRIIGDDTVRASTRSLACRLLVYVADETGKGELLIQLQRRWPERLGGELRALVQLGDSRTLRWFEAAASETEDERLRYHLENAAESVRVQQSNERLFAALESDNAIDDRGWLVRQAVRHGAEREAIRSALLGHLRRTRLKEDGHIGESSLVGAAEECAIFSDRDLDEFPAIREFRENGKYVAVEPVIHEWVTLINGKRAEFYGLNR